MGMHFCIHICCLLLKCNFVVFKTKFQKSLPWSWIERQLYWDFAGLMILNEPQLVL